MPSKEQRKHTDAKLHTERQKTDVEFVRRGGASEGEADEVLRRARERAARVLQAARDKADSHPGAVRQSKSDRIELATQRKMEDELLAQTRAQSDDILEKERAERRLALASLLALERDATDKALFTERALSDEAITARDDVLAMVGHDLRTLLGGISLATALLVQEATNDSAGRSTVRRAEVIQRHSVRMNRLIGDLVDIASIEARRLTVVAEPHDPNQVVMEAIDAFRDAASEKAIAVDADVAGEGELARFDYERILQVLGNLIGNALKFTDRGGRVLVSLERGDGEVQFAVRDTGVGMPPDMRAKIFERFWKGKTADRRGLGLGLFISRSIVEAHGGRIWVESTVGEGSTFYFTLPAA